MGYDQYTVRKTEAVEPTCFPLVLATYVGGLIPFFQISLKNSALKATHNTFRDCRVHFSRQPFSIYHLY